jgi:hypothetical protein
MKAVLAESVAMMAIGDGVLGVAFPVQHSTRWEFGPEPWRKCMRMWAEHPGLTRAVSALQIVAGLVLASRLPAPARK